MGLEIRDQCSVEASGDPRLLVRSPLDTRSVKKQRVRSRLRGRSGARGTTEDVGCFIDDWNGFISESRSESGL